MHNITYLFKISQRNKPLTYKISTHQRKTNRKYCVPAMKTVMFDLKHQIVLYNIYLQKEPKRHGFVHVERMRETPSQSFFHILYKYVRFVVLKMCLRIYNLKFTNYKMLKRQIFFSFQIIVHLLNLIYIEIED